MSTAVLLPGSASTGDFLRRAFPQVLAGTQIASWTPHGGDAASIAEQLAAFAADQREEPLTVIGVSVGAHAAALWARGNPRAQTRLLLAMPAWTGPAADVAAMTALAAQRIEEHGLAAELAALARQFPEDWVIAELQRAWGSADPHELVRTLRATARSAAPTAAQLGEIQMPTLVLGLRDDPMHPWAVARRWATAIPSAELVGLGRDEPQADITAFGRASAATAWAGLR